MKVFIMIVISLFLYADSDDIRENIHLPKDLSFLELNHKQKDILKNLLKKHQYQLKKLHTQEEAFEKVLDKNFENKTFDKKQFIKNSLKIKKEIVKIEADFFEKIHSVLDKKQRKKFIKHIEEWEVE